MASDRDTYWATRESGECVDALLARIKAYQESLKRSGREQRMRRAWSCYYGYGVDGQKSTNRLISGGEQGELTMIAPPIFGTLVRQVERLLTGQKPAYKTRATNSDSDAIVEAMLGDSLLDYYDRASALTEREGEAVRSGLLLASGYVALSWDAAVGDETATDTESGKVYRQGDVAARSFTPWDVAFDFRDPDEESRQWFAFRSRAKKFDLVAQYPACETELLRGSALKPDSTNDEGFARPWQTETEDEDNVWVWELRHKRTAALPNGRLLRFVSKDCVLYDSAEQKTEQAEGVESVSEDAGYPYPDLLAYEFAPEKVLGGSDGHTANFDLMGMQEAMEACATAAMTNINMGAVTNWHVMPGDAPQLTRLSSGANIIESKQKPEPIDGVQISPAMMEFFSLLRDLSQQAAGLNDVAMGDTPKGMPAQLAALLEAKAIQYHQQGQAAYYRLVERVRTGILKLLQRFASEPRVTELVGKANSWAQKTWSAQDIGRVTKVVVEPVNPMMKTFAGRMSMVEMLGEQLDKDARMSLMLTGSVEQKLDAPKAHEGRLAREKELLRTGVGMPPVDIAASMQQGAPVFVPAPGEFIRPLMSDRHWLDIPEYLSVLESPEARSNPKVVGAVLDLVMEHKRLWTGMDPDLLFLLGGPPAPSSQLAMMMGPMGAPGTEEPAPDGPPAPLPSGDMAAGEMRPVNLPKPPPSPLTGEQASPPMGAA